jgi:hypothetical protein
MFPFAMAPKTLRHTIFPGGIMRIGSGIGSHDGGLDRHFPASRGEAYVENFPYHQALAARVVRRSSKPKEVRLEILPGPPHRLRRVVHRLRVYDTRRELGSCPTQ